MLLCVSIKAGMLLAHVIPAITWYLLTYCEAICPTTYPQSNCYATILYVLYSTRNLQYYNIVLQYYMWQSWVENERFLYVNYWEKPAWNCFFFLRFCYLTLHNSKAYKHAESYGSLEHTVHCPTHDTRVPFPHESGGMLYGVCMCPPLITIHQ